MAQIAITYIDEKGYIYRVPYNEARLPSHAILGHIRKWSLASIKSLEELRK